MATRPRRYSFPPSDRAELHVEFRTDQKELVDYSVVLTYALPGSDRTTVRVYDFARGKHEMHRCRPDGQKSPAERFHDGRPDEGLEEAKRLIVEGFEGMIAGWRRSSTR